MQSIVCFPSQSNPGNCIITPSLYWRNISKCQAPQYRTNGTINYMFGGGNQDIFPQMNPILWTSLDCRSYGAITQTTHLSVFMHVSSAFSSAGGGRCICLSKEANLLFAAWVTPHIWTWPVTFRAAKWMTLTCGQQAGEAFCNHVLTTIEAFLNQSGLDLMYCGLSPMVHRGDYPAMPHWWYLLSIWV